MGSCFMSMGTPVSRETNWCLQTHEQSPRNGLIQDIAHVRVISILQGDWKKEEITWRRDASPDNRHLLATRRMPVNVTDDLGHVTGKTMLRTYILVVLNRWTQALWPSLLSSWDSRSRASHGWVLHTTVVPFNYYRTIVWTGIQGWNY